MIIYIPHGAGPLPLLNDSMYFKLIDFIKHIGQKIPKPDAIIVISAHWEEEGAYITSGKQLSLIYDFSGFPKESYQLAYPVSGSPILAQRLFEVFSKNKMNTRLDSTRGIDHGVYVPLMHMYPQANVPCVQVSLQRNLDSKVHIQMGNALRELKSQNVLIIGSGFSFHHMGYFFDNDSMANSKNDQFHDWLIKTCTEKNLSQRDCYYHGNKHRIHNFVIHALNILCH